MAYVGRRIEVYWPPDGDEVAGTWYRGLLDHYVDKRQTAGNVGGDSGESGGYHVAYDDGDEEMLGDIDDRSDVRLLDAPQEDDDSNAHESSAHDFELATGHDDGKTASQLDDGAHHRPTEEIPTGSTLEHANEDGGSNDFTQEAPVEATVDFPQGEFLSRGFNMHQSSLTTSQDRETYARADVTSGSAGRSGERDGDDASEARAAVESENVDFAAAMLYSSSNTTHQQYQHNLLKTFRKNERQGSSHLDVHEVRLGEWNLEASTDLAAAQREKIPRRATIDSHRHTHNGYREHGVDGKSKQHRAQDTVEVRQSFSSEDSDDDRFNRLFTPPDGGEGGSEGSHSSGRRSDEGGTFSLSTDSSEWTPLRGAELLHPSPARMRDSWSAIFADEEVHNRSNRGEDGQVPAHDERAASDEKASELRLTSSAPTGRGGLKQQRWGHSNSDPTLAVGRNHRRGGGWVRFANDSRVVKGTAIINAQDGPEDEPMEWEAVEGTVYHTATISGAVDGVEGRFYGGVFVKVSFVDGGGEDATTNAMFHCKTLIHTTGSTAGASCNGRSGWIDGKFQCQAFHGGRVTDLANSAVLFSAHRGEAADSNRTSTHNDATRRRDSFLGQVLLPLRTALNDLRPVVVAEHYPEALRGDRLDDGADHYPVAPEQDHSDDRADPCLMVPRQQHIPDEEAIAQEDKLRESEGREKHVDRRQSLRGDISGIYPVADRRGRLYSTERERVSLRLRLSVSFPLKQCTSSGTISAHRQPKTLGRVVGTPAKSSYSTVGARDGGEHLSSGPRQVLVRGAWKGYISARNTDVNALPPCNRARSVGSIGRGNQRGVSYGRGQREGSVGHSCPNKERHHRHHPAIFSSEGGSRARRQQEITRENERMKHRLRAIREAAPRKHLVKSRATNLGRKVKRRIVDERNRRQGRLREVRQTATLRHMEITTKVNAEKASDPRRRHSDHSRDLESGKPRPGVLRTHQGILEAASAAEHEKGKVEKARWRDLYGKREALALETENTAAEVAEVRARVEALRARTLWTEANARRYAASRPKQSLKEPTPPNRQKTISLAVASLQKTMNRRRRTASAASVKGTPVRGGRNQPPGVGNGGKATGGLESEVEWKGILGNFFPGVVGDVKDKELAAELRRQEKLHQAFVLERRKAVVRAEEARLAREADLQKLNDVKIQLKQAEGRQARYLWRLKERSQHPSTDTLPGLPYLIGKDPKEGEILPKDAFEDAQDLVLSLRVEVETLRLGGTVDEGMAEPSLEGAKEEARSRAVREAQEELATARARARVKVASLMTRLGDKRRRLEAICFERDAARAEYQDLVSKHSYFALKESLVWLDHASLQLSRI